MRLRLLVLSDMVDISMRGGLAHVDLFPPLPHPRTYSQYKFPVVLF